MKKIIVTIDDKTHRQAQLKAAELGTSLSELVRNYLRSFVSQEVDADGANARTLGTEDSHRRRLLSEVVEEITASGGGLRMSENLSREELYGERFKNRNTLR